MVRSARDRGLHLPLVRRAPASQLRDRRDAGDGLPDAARAHARRSPRWSRRWSRSSAEHFDAGEKLSRYPYEMLDENKWLAARHGLDGELVDLPSRERVPPGTSRGGCWTACAGTPRTSARPTSWTASRTCSTGAPAARARCVVYEANHDLREVVGEIVEKTSPSVLGRRREPARSTLIGVSQPDLFVVCKNCGSEV